MSEQFVLDLSQPGPPGFDNFVAGANREAMAASMALARGESGETGVLLWGAPGAGKTHLLRATAAMALRARTVIECPTPGAVLPADDLPPAALVTIDDIDAAGDAEQARLFTVLNALAASRGQWLGCAQAPPARLPLREDLRTRLALGLVLEVIPLVDADKPQALTTFARERGFGLSDDVIAYLLAHGRRDMPSLVATLAALDRHSLATQRAITIPLLREWLQRGLGLSR